MRSVFSSEKELTGYLFSLRRYGIRLGLENISRLLDNLGNPQEKFLAAHIAGTNGKGSTGALLASIFQQSNVKTGLYVSPHLLSFRERIQVNGFWIPFAEVARRVARMRPVIDTYHCTFFEVMTALAFDYFAAQEVELAVIETGLGGRLDATNILSPALSIITEIDLDHMADLGSTIRDIAREKAGIIKPGVPLVTSAHSLDALEVLAEVCAERGSPFYPVIRECQYSDVRTGVDGTIFSAATPVQVYTNLRLNLLGQHQICNALAAIRAAELMAERRFHIREETIRKGLEKARWPGRFEIVSRKPILILDIAHNPNGIHQLVKTFRDIFPKRKAWVLMGVLADKNFEAMVREVASIAKRIIAATPSNPRALSATELAREFSKTGLPATPQNTVREGIQFLQREASPSELLLITGSNYTVSDALTVLSDFRFTENTNS